jgi:hypothetical protein
VTTGTVSEVGTQVLITKLFEHGWALESHNEVLGENNFIPST